MESTSFLGITSLSGVSASCRRAADDTKNITGFFFFDFSSVFWYQVVSCLCKYACFMERFCTTRPSLAQTGVWRFPRRCKKVPSHRQFVKRVRWTCQWWEQPTAAMIQGREMLQSWLWLRCSPRRRVEGSAAPDLQNEAIEARRQKGLLWQLG